MKRFFINPEKGFTVMELLVVFTITVLVAGVSFVSFVTYSKKQAVEQASLDVETLIDRAKANTLSRVRPEDKIICADGSSCDCAVLKNFEVRFGADKSYATYVICGNGEALVEKKYLPQDVSFDSNSTGCKIKFYLLSNTASSTDCYSTLGSNVARIIVEGNGFSNVITVDRNGNVGK